MRSLSPFKAYWGFLARSLTTILLLVALASPVAAADSVLRIDYPDYWPFFSRTEEGRMTGFFYEIVSTAFQKMGINSTWESYPWGRCQTHVQAGLADAMITVPTPERLVYTETHTTPFYQKELTVFTYKDNPAINRIQEIKAIDDIAALNLSVITYTGNGWNDRNIKSRGIKTYETPMLENVWTMLANKRGDLVIEWPDAAWPDIKKTNCQGDVVKTKATLEAMPFHLLIRKDNAHSGRLQEFDNIIRQMKDDGTIEAITIKYSSEFRLRASQ